MAGSSLLVLDELIRKPGDNATIVTGLGLYHALTRSGRVVLLAGEDEDRAEWFLATNGLKDHAQVVYERRMSGSTPAERRMDQVNRVRSSSSVDLVVEPDPRIAASLLEAGLPVLVFLHPQYTAPAFRPDADRRTGAWADLISVVEYQEHLKVNDHRTESDDDQ